jgi:hypothetical protein
VDLLIPADPAEIYDIEKLETVQDTSRPSRTKKTEEVQEIDNAFVKNASISLEQGGDGEDLNDKEVEKNQVDEVDPLKKRKGSPPKPSSRKKSKSSMTKMQTVLTSDEFDFLIASLQDASLEIVEKQESKQEKMYDRIETELQGVQQALQSSGVVSIAPGEPELGDESTQIHRLADTVKVHLR